MRAACTPIKIGTGHMPFHPGMTRPNCDQGHLDEVEKSLTLLADKHRAAYPVAAQWLKYYLSKKGGTVEANPNWLRMSASFRNAVERLRLRIERELVNAIFNELTGKMTSRQITTVEGEREVGEKVNAEIGTDLYLASNKSVVIARANFNLWQQPGLPGIGGQAEFLWSDRYNWDRDRFFAWAPFIPTVHLEDSPTSFLSFEDIDDLQACPKGPAKEFDVEAKWTARVQTTQRLDALVKWVGGQTRTQWEIDNRIKRDSESRQLFLWFGL